MWIGWRFKKPDLSLHLISLFALMTSETLQRQKQTNGFEGEKEPRWFSYTSVSLPQKITSENTHKSNYTETKRERIHQSCNVRLEKNWGGDIYRLQRLKTRYAICWCWKIFRHHHFQFNYLNCLKACSIALWFSFCDAESQLLNWRSQTMILDKNSVSCSTQLCWLHSFSISTSSTTMSHHIISFYSELGV